MDKGGAVQQYQESRFLWADVIRIVAIYLIIFTHSTSFLPKREVGNLWFWIPAIYTQAIGIGLFVVLSGALLLKKKETIGVFFKKRLRAVGLPWVAWISAYIALEYFVLGVRQETFVSWIRYAYVMFMSRLWFLPMIAGIYMLTPLIRVFVEKAKKRDFHYAVGVWLFAFSLLPTVRNLSGATLNLDGSLLRFVMQYSGLFLLGYLFVTYFTKRFTIGFWLKMLLISILSTYLLVTITSVGKIEVDPFFYRVMSPTMIFAPLIVFAMLYQLSVWWEKSISPFQRKLIQQLSEASLGIYLVHEIVVTLLLRFSPEVEQSFRLVSPVLAVPLHATMIFVLSSVIIFSLRRISFLRIFT